MRKLSVSLAVLAFILITATAQAGRRPHEGKIANIDATAKTLTVQGEKGDSWTLSWDDTTKWNNNLTPQELRTGDSIHFDFIEKSGQKWVTEIRRTRKAKM